MDKEITVLHYRHLYDILIKMYPKCNIQTPDFNLPLEIIEEQYERDLNITCNYNMAMKLKVYLIMGILAIEFLGGDKCKELTNS